MSNAFRQLANQKPAQDDGYARLLCTEPGCGRRWTVQFDKPQCSFHAWGRVGERYASLASAADDGDGNHDGKAWARRIVRLHESGEPIRPISLELAQKALRIHKGAAHTGAAA